MTEDNLCDITGCSKNSVSFSRYGDGSERRLCDYHQSQEIKRANYDLYVKQIAQRADLSRDWGIPLLVMVQGTKNLNGEYVVSIENPLMGCSPGFGSTPVRALRDFALKLADEADKVLHRVNEQEFERRQLKEELGIADV